MNVSTCDRVSRRAMAGMVGLVTIVSSSVHAATLFTTQEDFAQWGVGDAAVTRAASTTSLDAAGVLNGLGNISAPLLPGTGGSLQLTRNTGSFHYIRSPGEAGNAAFLAALGTTNTGAGYTPAAGVVTFDYTTPPAGTGNYFQLNLLLNYNNNFGQFTGGTTVDNGNGTSTRTIPYTINATTASNYFELGIIYNSNYDSGLPFTVDNIQAVGAPVPEPTTLGAVAGAVGLLAARRRRA